jgi:hypothetical protein
MRTRRGPQRRTAWHRAHEQVVVRRGQVVPSTQVGHQSVKLLERLGVDLTHRPREPVDLVPGRGRDAPQYELTHPRRMLDRVREPER